MSFDENPDDKYERILVSHEESDSLFEVFSRAEFAQCVNGDPCCADVTGEPFWEEKFKNEQNQKRI